MTTYDDKLTYCDDCGKPCGLYAYPVDRGTYTTEVLASDCCGANTQTGAQLNGWPGPRLTIHLAPTPIGRLVETAFVIHFETVAAALAYAKDYGGWIFTPSYDPAYRGPSVWYKPQMTPTNIMLHESTQGLRGYVATASETARLYGLPVPVREV